MDTDSLKKGLEIWKYALFINIGASITLLATAIADLPNISGSYFPGWYGVWFVVQLSSFLPGFVLLLGNHWMQIPLRERLNTIFGYFVTTLVNALSVGFRIDPRSADVLHLFFLGCAVFIAIGYGGCDEKALGFRVKYFHKSICRWF